MEAALIVLFVGGVPLVFVASWIVLRLAPGRNVPRLYFAVTRSVALLCFAIAMFLLVLPKGEQHGGLQGIGEEMAAILLVVNSIFGGIVLTILACLPQSARSDRVDP